MQGRQLTWLISDHFEMSATQGEPMETKDLLRVRLVQDNVEACSNAFDYVLLRQSRPPDDTMLESTFFQQLEHNIHVKTAITYYKMMHCQNIPVAMSYITLRRVVHNLCDEGDESYVDEYERTWKWGDGKADSRKGKEEGRGEGKGKDAGGNSKQICYTRARMGKCSRGDKCPYSHDFPKGGRKGKGGKGKGKRSRGKGSKAPPGLCRRRSPPGEADRPPCRFHRNGQTCAEGDNCKFWHQPDCTFHKRGKCEKGNKCRLRHAGSNAKPAAATADANKAKA